MPNPLPRPRRRLLAPALSCALAAGALGLPTPSGAQSMAALQSGQLAPRYHVAGCDQHEAICLELELDRLGFDLELDGTPVRTLVPCASDTLTSYALDSLLGPSGESAYEITWRFTPTAYRTRLSTGDSLLAFLRERDPAGAWRIDSTECLLVGTPNLRYGILSAYGLDSRTARHAEPQAYVSSFGHTFDLAPGRHTFVTIGELGQRDTTLLDVTCGELPTDTVTVAAGIVGEHCLTVPGEPDAYTYTLLCDEADARVVEFYGVRDGCLTFRAHGAGVTYTCVSYCDRGTGDCAEVGVYFRVIPEREVRRPTAQNDLYGIGYNGQRMLQVLANDEYSEAGTTVTLRTGVTRGEVRVDPRNRVQYTAPQDYCGLDRISYTLCNAGGCDTASVRVEVACEELLAFNGISPNGDGRNDVFTVLGLENFPENQLLVFDQHGHLVYARENYANDWNAVSGGTPLLNGTYFYVLQISGRAPMSGPLQIVR